MKTFSIRYHALLACSILLFTQLSPNSPSILRITIAHKEANYIWQEELVNQLQTTIESVAPSLLEAKLVSIGHHCDGNKVTFDIKQHEKKNIREKLSSVVSSIRKMSAIVVNRLQNALSQVMHIPYDLFIYYNPVSQTAESVVSTVADVPALIADPANEVETILDDVQQPIAAITDMLPIETEPAAVVLAVVTPDAKNSVASVFTDIVDGINNSGTPIIQQINDGVLTLSGNHINATNIVPVIVDNTAQPVVALEEVFISPILDVNNTIDDQILDPANDLGNPIVYGNLSDLGNNDNAMTLPTSALQNLVSQPVGAVVAIVAPAIASTPVAQLPVVSNVVNTITNAASGANNQAQGSNKPSAHIIGLL